MSDNARDARKTEREKREARKRAERTVYVRHLKEELIAGENQLLDSKKRLDVDPDMRGLIDKSVANKLTELGNRYKIKPDELMVLKQLALLYRFYPSTFLEKCSHLEQCFNAGIDPFELICLGELYMEFSMYFLYEIQAMRKGVRLAKKRKAESLKAKDDRRFAKVYYQYLDKKDTLENLLKKAFPERVKESKEIKTYNSLKSAYYRAVNRIFLKDELTFYDLLQFFWDKTALLFSFDSDGNLLQMPWRVVLKSSKTRSKLGVIRDYMLGINTKKIILSHTCNRRSPYDEMWNRLAPKQPDKE